MVSSPVESLGASLRDSFSLFALGGEGVGDCLFSSATRLASATRQA